MNCQERPSRCPWQTMLMTIFCSRLPLSFSMQDGLTRRFHSLMNHVTGLFNSGMKQTLLLTRCCPAHPCTKWQQTGEWVCLLLLSTGCNQTKQLCVLGRLLLMAVRDFHSAKSFLQGLPEKQKVLTLKASRIPHNDCSDTLKLHYAYTYILD